MVEADHIVTQTPAPNHAQPQAERMRIAVRVEAQRRAREEVKAQIRRGGRVKLSEVPAREITAMAEARLIEDVEYEKAHRRGEGRRRAMAVGSARRTFHILTSQRGK